MTDALLDLLNKFENAHARFWQADADTRVSIEGRWELQCASNDAELKLRDAIAAITRELILTNIANDEIALRHKAEQRVAALVGALAWIDNADPEIVAAAETKFGFTLAALATEA